MCAQVNLQAATERVHLLLHTGTVSFTHCVRERHCPEDRSYFNDKLKAGSLCQAESRMYRFRVEI